MCSNANIARDAALDYADLGLRPVPLKPGTKHPSGGHGWQIKASREPRSIKSRFRQGYNIGLMMGDRDQHNRMLFTVDVDAKAGANLRTFVAGREWPDTPTDVTPTGGNHVLFYGPPGMVIRSRTNALAPGVDIVGDGGQVVVEPSTRTDFPGQPYLWTKHPSAYPVAQAPAWIAEQILEVQGHKKSYPLPKGAARETRPAPSKAQPSHGQVNRPQAPSVATGSPSLLARMIAKYTVTGNVPGEHNDRMMRMGPEVIFGTATDQEAFAVYEGWWTHWNLLGLCDPVDSDRIDRRIAYLRRCQESGKITRPSGESCNRDEALMVALSPAQLAECESLTLKIHTRGRRGNPGHLEAMIKTVVITSLQSRMTNGPGAVKSTVKEWRSVLLERFGLDLHPTEFDRLKKALVRLSPTPGVPAQEAGVFELMRETVKGFHCNTPGGFKRVPSEFVPGEWLEGVLALPSARLVDGVPTMVDGGSGRVEWVEEDDFVGKALPAPVLAPAAAAPLEPAPGPVEADGGKESSTVGAEFMIANRPRVRVVARESDISDEPIPDPLPFPSKPGLADIVEQLIASGRFGPQEVAEMVRRQSNRLHRAQVTSAQEDER